MRNPMAKVSDPNKFVTCPGDRFHKLYSSKVMPNGEIHLKESGKEDIQEYINSFKDTCDMAYILAELQKGNTAVLNQRNAMYGDFTDVPANLAEALQIMIDGEAAFNQLPVEVKKQFDNNFRNWLFTSGSSEWTQKMSSIIEKIEEVESVPVEEKTDVS